MKRPPWILPLMGMGLIALLAALGGGIVRIGWDLGPIPPAFVAFHGPLMVSGFLGTVISLERAFGLGRRWGYLAPLSTGLGAMALLVGAALPVSPLLMTLGSAALIAILVTLSRRPPDLPEGVLLAGAGAWLAGNALWLAGWPIFRVVPWWMAFLVLTIGGERLELSRVLRPSRAARRAVWGAVATLLAGVVISGLRPQEGARIAGAGMLALSCWLLIHDLARRTLRETGLRRYIAACLYGGFLWLGVSGCLALRSGGAAAGLSYDALLHSLFLGFVFSMIFGHAPIILPGVAGVQVPFRRRFYLHLGLLHASLALRVAGDLLPSAPLRTWGGLLNAAAILLFLVNTLSAVRTPSRS